MNIKAGIVSFTVSFLGCGIVLAAGVFNTADSKRDITLPAYDGVGLLVPQTEGDSQYGGIANLDGNIPVSSDRYKSRRVARNSPPAPAESVSPTAAASGDKPWGIAVLAIAGLAGGIGVAAFGAWMRWKHHNRTRGSVPKVLLANLSQPHQHAEEVRTVTERQTDSARRAA